MECQRLAAELYSMKMLYDMANKCYIKAIDYAKDLEGEKNLVLSSLHVELGSNYDFQCRTQDADKAYTNAYDFLKL